MLHEKCVNRARFKMNPVQQKAERQIADRGRKLSPGLHLTDTLIINSVFYK